MRMAFRNARAAFPDVRLYIGHVTTYPGVVWSFMLCGERLDIDADVAGARAAERKITARYWTPEAHVGSFGVPGIIHEGLEGDSRNPFAP
jgi:spermidine synthase